MRKKLSNNLDDQFINRWSPRAFLSDPIPEKDLMTMFEAAHWAPSCFNEQPWLFVYAQNEADRKRFLEALVEGNRAWAHTAPVLMFIFSKKHFNQNGKENRWAGFDTGAAWMSFNLQALKLGYHCHGMGGYDVEKAYEVTGVPKEKYNVICAMVVGKKASPENLDAATREKEQPNARKELSGMVFENLFDIVKEQ